MSSEPHWVIGITGASGILYAISLIRHLAQRKLDLDVIVSDDAVNVMKHELDLDNFLSENLTGKPLDTVQKKQEFIHLLLYRDIKPLRPIKEIHSNISIFNNKEMAAPIASGSNLLNGMIVIPASLTSIAKIAQGLCDNLIARASEVMLKEKRPLIVVPRETPLSLIALRNLTSISEAGGIVAPAMPGFYNKPGDIGDILDFMVGKILNLMKIEQNTLIPWGEKNKKEIV